MWDFFAGAVLAAALCGFQSLTFARARSLFDPGRAETQEGKSNSSGAWKDGDPVESSSEEPFHKPDVIEFGATVPTMQTKLTKPCQRMRARRIDPPFLEHVHQEQMQIDCEGFSFQGAPRHAEFVFRDDALVMVWIMTGQTEEAALERAMTDAYGAGKRRGRKYLQFAKGGAALRLDKHEVLFYSSTLAEEVETWFLDADRESK